MFSLWNYLATHRSWFIVVIHCILYYFILYLRFVQISVINIESWPSSHSRILPIPVVLFDRLPTLLLVSRHNKLGSFREDLQDEESDEEVSDDEGSYNSEDDPNRLWCICQKPHNNRYILFSPPLCYLLACSPLPWFMAYLMLYVALCVRLKQYLEQTKKYKLLLLF